MTEPVNIKDQLIQNIKDGKPVIANVRFSQPFVFDPRDNKGIVIANCAGVGGQQNPTVNNKWIDELLIPEDNCLKIPGEHCGSCVSGYEDSSTSDMLCCDHANWRDKSKAAITAKLESIEQEAREQEEIETLEWVHVQLSFDGSEQDEKYIADKLAELKGKG